LPASGVPVAVRLYAQAAFWAARGLARVRKIPAGEDFWSALDRTVLERSFDVEGRLAELVSFVEDRAKFDVWELPREQQAHLARDLKRLARAILSELELPEKAHDSLFFQRVIRVGGFVAIIALVLGLVSWQRSRAEDQGDLAKGKHWRTSSSYGPNLGCLSPAQQCAESPDLFFHTKDENGPWVEIDLGQPTQFSRVRVENRRDCCFERAVPLIVEVSNTQDKFKEVSRRTSSFTSWLARFSPVEARYVRVRAPSRTALHLYRVRVLL
jgi:hypothetical protein